MRFWTDFGFYKKTQQLVAEGLPASCARVKLSRVVSGKFRRYAHFKKIDYLKHPSIMLSNLLDLLKVGVGLVQCFFKLIFWRPNVVFLKGGFVCLPIGLAARVLRIPIVIHDSDVAAGLTNRILARFAQRTLSGMPESNLKGAQFVGVPVAADLHKTSKTEQSSLKTSLGFDPERPLVLFTGGGLGAQRLNEVVLTLLPELQDFTQVFLITGGAAGSLATSCMASELPASIVDFTPDMPKVIKAADVVVARAGATTIAELAAAGKPTVLVPNAKLPGSHQVRNAESLQSVSAAEILSDDDLANKPRKLLQTLRELIKNSAKREELSRNILAFAQPNAATKIAEIVIGVGQDAER